MTEQEQIQLNKQLKAIKETTTEATHSKKAALDYLNRAGLLATDIKPGEIDLNHVKPSTIQRSRIS